MEFILTFISDVIDTKQYNKLEIILVINVCISNLDFTYYLI